MVVLASDAVEEFTKIHLPRAWDLSFDERLKPATIPSVTPAATFDWRVHGAVTSVKNQVRMEITSFSFRLTIFLFLNNFRLGRVSQKRSFGDS